MHKHMYVLLVLFLFTIGCTAVPSTNESIAVQAEPTRPVSASTVVPTATATTEALKPLIPNDPNDRPPAGAQSQFDTDFSMHSIPYSEVLSGGPPKDGIPAIDAPKFVTVAQADEWLEDVEPVVVINLEGVAKVYPIQILMWHEIVNDVVGQVPVSVTFCPLCNTAIAFDRRTAGRTLDFGTTGRLRYSNLLMYDRQTETWWQQASGEAVVGTLMGSRLTFLPAVMMSWVDATARYPDAEVLSRETGHPRDYGRNPYAGYDNVRNTPFLYRGPTLSDKLLPMARVLKVELGDEVVAYPFDVMQEMRVANDFVGGQPVVVLWRKGVASALDASSISSGRDVGTVNVYDPRIDGRVLTFVWQDARIVDKDTGSEWDGLGRAIDGPMQGAQLEPLVGVNHFWFSWVVYRPDTRVYVP